MAERQDSNGQASSVERGRLGLPLHIEAALQSRAQLAHRLGLLFDGRRNLHQLLGYKSVLDYRDFKARYRRQHIAHRLARVYPEATWAYPPTIKEDNNTDTDTAFEAGWKALEARLHVLSILERTDILANLGQYACLLIGLKGQADLSAVATPVQSPDDILYLTPYSEEFAKVQQLETNAGLPTFGQPLYYTFQFSRGSTLGGGGLALPTPGGRVHASRVIHATEDLLDDDVFGIPRLEPIFDLLDDMYKVEGGAGEMFWRDALRRLVFALRDDAKMSKDDEKALTAEVEEFIHEIRPFVRVQGMDVNAIMGTVASPKEHMEVITTLIASTMGIPKRMLEGTERGSLASSQDEAAWLQRVARRQVQVAEQRLLRPFLDRLLLLKALPRPAKGYTVDWGNLLALSEEQQAAVVKDYATALAQAMTAGDYAASTAISRTLVQSLGYDPEDPLLVPEPALLAPTPEQPPQEL
jgi:uncharacterized protein